MVLRIDTIMMSFLVKTLMCLKLISVLRIVYSHSIGNYRMKIESFK